MNILVTAGNTQTPIDRVRCITNIFTGRTGAALALQAARQGHHVTLLTSHPERVHESGGADAGLTVTPYRTFEELHDLMATHVLSGQFDAVLHAAAVSDYYTAGVFAPAPGTSFDPQAMSWHGPGLLVDRAAGKVKSDEPEMWLRLVRAPKLVDRIRRDWRFKGTLVKFKLEVGVSDEQLLEIAERSRRQSEADWMVANTLEGAREWAFVGPFAHQGYRKVARGELAGVVLDAISKS